jgi:dnd system-associated protein 4
MSTATGLRRVHRASDKEDIVKQLTTGETPLFREIWRLLMFAAQVGYKAGLKEPLAQVDAGKGIDQTTFSNSPAWPGMLYLLALASTERTDALVGTVEGEELRMTLFQEYANGGLSLLADFFARRPVDLDGMLAFIDSHRETGSKKPNLDFSL